jgi:hypothetical protein
VNGKTDPQHLAKHRDDRCRSSEGEIAAALTGNYRPEHVFVLKQNLELYNAIQQQIKACDTEIEGHLIALAAKATEPAAPLATARTRRRKRSNEPQFDVGRRFTN